MIAIVVAVPNQGRRRSSGLVVGSSNVVTTPFFSPKTRELAAISRRHRYAAALVSAASVLSSLPVSPRTADRHVSLVDRAAAGPGI
jgi:hypothetical protein